VPATLENGCKDQGDGQDNLLEFIKMYPIVFYGYKVIRKTQNMHSFS
jgi:hypothetical protein